MLETVAVELLLLLALLLLLDNAFVWLNVLLVHLNRLSVVL